MFPVDMLSHHIIKRVPVSAFLAVVHCLLNIITCLIQANTILQANPCSLKSSSILAHDIVGHMKQSDVCLQSLFVPIVSAIGAVKENAVFKVLAVHVTKVTLVGGEKLGGECTS